MARDGTREPPSGQSWPTNTVIPRAIHVVPEVDEDRPRRDLMPFDRFDAVEMGFIADPLVAADHQRFARTKLFERGRSPMRSNWWLMSLLTPGGLIEQEFKGQPAYLAALREHS